MSDRQSWVIVALLILLFATGFAIGQIWEVQRQLDHIDTHFQAPEPTPVEQGVTG